MRAWVDAATAYAAACSGGGCSRIAQCALDIPKGSPESDIVGGFLDHFHGIHVKGNASRNKLVMLSLGLEGGYGRVSAGVLHHGRDHQ